MSHPMGTTSLTGHSTGCVHLSWPFADLPVLTIAAASAKIAEPMGVERG